MLSEAQAQLIEVAHVNGGEIYARAEEGSEQVIATATALVARGLLANMGAVRDPDTLLTSERYELTAAGRKVYATHGRIMRQHRCKHPICCGVWAEESGAKPTHGSCRVCHRWSSLTSGGGLVRSHNGRPGLRCLGSGVLPIGAAATNPTT